MTISEAMDTINAISKIDMSCVDLKDQMEYMSALNGFAEKIKPIVIKYLDKVPPNANFLMKL